MSEELCKIIFKQLILAINYMHLKGKAHRDLKLDNILYDAETRQIKIIDFGFSLETKKEQKLDTYCGTPHYMDPDIVKKVPYSAFAADIWAAGVILYIIYVGSLPFFGEFEADLYRRIQSGKFKRLPSDLGDQQIRSLF
jgi:serine/threonine protein kinase